MNEFIEKLIERLEEEKEYCSYNPKIRDETIKKVIEIVNQLAEEYNNESVKGDLISRSALLKELHKIEFPSYKNYDLQDVFDMCEDKVEQAPIAHNDGWIPCSERLPCKEQKVIACINPSIAKHEIILIPYESWNICWHDGSIIAWQPLPEPYKPKGE